MDKPITERSNALSVTIDVLSPQGIVGCLDECDSEIFQGWQGSGGILSESLLTKLEQLSQLIHGIFQNPENCVIVLGGCGTSGRLAFFISRAFNEKIPCFDYLIAGGDRALFTSQEAHEDDPDVGVTDLIKVCEGKKRVVFVGITCGLSAPYVAGQLDYCMQHLDVFTPVLLGFNPVSQARKNPIENWDKTFSQVAEKLETLVPQQKAFIINPVIGPEAITGSSRMKGGSATKILLEVLFSSALANLTQLPHNINNMISAYSIVKETVHACKPALAEVIQLAGKCLQSGGHIYYISSDRLGAVGMLDASECPPTYGADFDDVRGFISGGFAAYDNKQGDLSNFVEISVDYFKKAVVPTLTEHDVLVFLTSEGDICLDLAMISIPARTVLISCILSRYQPPQSGDMKFDVKIEVPLPTDKLEEILPRQLIEDNKGFYCELACKWICNALTTGAHILKGKVYSNFMVDVRVSNNKLFHRAEGIIERMSGCSTESAREYLLKAIYGCETVCSGTISQHIAKASVTDRVVPVALVMSLSGCCVEEAISRLTETPVASAAIRNSHQTASSTSIKGGDQAM